MATPCDAVLTVVCDPHAVRISQRRRTSRRAARRSGRSKTRHRSASRCQRSPRCRTRSTPTRRCSPAAALRPSSRVAAWTIVSPGAPLPARAPPAGLAAYTTSSFYRQSVSCTGIAVQDCRDCRCRRYTHRHPSVTLRAISELHICCRCPCVFVAVSALFSCIRSLQPFLHCTRLTAAPCFHNAKSA